MKKHICVLGMGYMGLPMAALFAKQGYPVLGVDINPKRISDLKKGRVSNREPKLKELVQKVIRNKTLRLSTEPEIADVFIIAVPSPLNGHKKADLSFAKNASKMIRPFLKKDNLVIVETTVVPGSCKDVILPILEESKLLAGRDFSLAFCPERAIPGKTIYEIINNDRIIGGLNKKSAERAKSIYSSIVKGKITLTDLNTAEMVKIMENTARDVNIALANEFAMICEDLGINFWKAKELANRHPRVNILNAGPGVGGHCVPVDPWFLNHEQSNLMKLSREVNDGMAKHVIKILKKDLAGVARPKIAVLGLAYKANVDDARETPARRVIEYIQKLGWQAVACDPLVTDPSFANVKNIHKATHKADYIVLLTDHEEFKQIDPGTLKKLNGKRLLDTRNSLDLEKWQKAGFQVKIIGNGILNNLW